MLNERLNTLQQMNFADEIVGNFYSKEYIRKRILKQTQEEIEEIDKIKRLFLLRGFNSVKKEKIIREIKKPNTKAIPPILTKDFFFCFLGLGESINFRLLPSFIMYGWRIIVKTKEEKAKKTKISRELKLRNIYILCFLVYGF